MHRSHFLQLCNHNKNAHQLWGCLYRSFIYGCLGKPPTSSECTPPCLSAQQWGLACTTVKTHRPVAPTKMFPFVSLLISLLISLLHSRRTHTVHLNAALGEALPAATPPEKCSELFERVILSSCRSNRFMASKPLKLSCVHEQLRLILL